MDDFETDSLREIRRVRLDAEDDADNTGFVTPSGQEKRWTGNDAAPYTAALGRASSDGEDTPPTGIPAVEDGDPQELLLDQYGRVWVRQVDPIQIVEPVFSRSTTAGAALAQSSPIVVPSGQRMRLRWMGASMAGGAGAGRVLMAFDSAVAVGNGAVPIWRAPIGDNGAGYFNSVDVEIGDGGIIVSGGLVLAISSTLGTLTLGDTGFFQSLYNLETV